MERTVSSRLIHEGRNFRFLQDEVELPSGRRTKRDIVKHPGAVAVVPFLPDERVVLVRQYRYAVGKPLLEIPAGTLEDGEDPLECARRELREETGYGATELTPILSCYMAPGYSDEVIHFYEARGLREVGMSQEEDESIEIDAYEFGEIVRMIEANIIEDAKTIIGIRCLKGGQAHGKA
ncbi:NUDIX hydrolase [Candidatus Bathyarchaeota archaeon]|nr:NUDIX hydrolase [Candidatus Bathyarchaeota archaeon]